LFFAVPAVAELTVPLPPIEEGGARPAGVLEPYRVAPQVGIWLDGTEGLLQAVGRIRKTDKIQPDSYEYRVIKERATEEGRRQLVAAVAQLRIDDARVVGDDAEAMRRVHALIAALGPQAVRYQQDLYVEADVVLPLRGLSGVLGMILERGTPEISYQNGEPHEGGATGLIVDAGHLDQSNGRLTMALLPRIVDDAGRVVYDINQVDHDLARERGMAAYALEIPTAQAKPAEPQSRIGERPLRVKALAAGGNAKTDIVIAAADADRILEAAATSPFLRDCRVTVLMPSPPPPPALTRPQRPPQRPPADPNTLH